METEIKRRRIEVKGKALRSKEIIEQDIIWWMMMFGIE